MGEGCAGGDPKPFDGSVTDMLTKLVCRQFRQGRTREDEIKLVDGADQLTADSQSCRSSQIRVGKTRYVFTLRQLVDTSKYVQVVPKFEMVRKERPDLQLPSSQVALDKTKAWSHNFNVDQRIGTIVLEILCSRSTENAGWYNKNQESANVRFEDEGEAMSN